MVNLEHRISQIETELERVVRQNRSLRLYFAALAVLASMPLLSGWVRSGSGNFDLVTASQLQIKSTDGKVRVLIGSTSGSSGGPPGGLIYVTDRAGQTVGQLDGYSNGGGTLKLMEMGTPNSDANSGLVQLTVEKFGSGKARGLIKLFDQNRGREAIRIESGGGYPGRIALLNAPRLPLVNIGASSIGNGEISVRDRDGKSEALLEALAPSRAGFVSRGAGRLSDLKVKTSTIAAGGSLTLKGPDGNIIFKAPGETKTP